KPETKESFKLPPKSRVNVEAEIKYPNIFILRGYSFSSAILLSFFSASSIETLLKATSLERLFNLAILSKLIVLLVTLLVLEIETKESFKLPPKSRLNVEAEIKYPNIFILRGYSFSSAILLSFFSASSIETLLKATSLERLFNLAILSKLIVLLVTLLVLEI